MLTHKVINEMDIDELRNYAVHLQELISAYHITLNGYEQQVEILRRQIQDEGRLINLNHEMGRIERRIEEKYYVPPVWKGESE